MDVPPEVIEQSLNRVIEILIRKYDELGMRATGEWADELEGRTAINRGSIWGMPYTEQLVQGRAPGKRPPIAPLERWAQAKFGLSGQQARSTAFAVANKIAESGTTWYQKGGSDLVEVLESPEVMEAFYGPITEYLLAEVRVTIMEELRRLNVAA